LADAPAAAPAKSPSLATGWRIYADRRVRAMLFLGFASGLPFPLVFTTLSAWLATAGVSKATIGTFSLVGLAYSFKVVWAPLLDRWQVPVLGPMLGRRRGWMLLCQLLIAVILLAMSGAEPAADLAVVAWLTVALAFASATQDVAIDAWRIEIVSIDGQGAMAAAYQLGYRVAMLAAGAGALYLADAGSWQLAYRVMALLMVVGVVAVILVAEPAAAVRRVVASPMDWVNEVLVQPFAEFFRRTGPYALMLLLFISLYRVSDMLLGVMANPFYVEMGFTLSEIATVSKVAGLAVTLVGAALGGLAVSRYGAVRPLMLGAIMLAASNLFFIGLASAGHSVPWLVLAICADNLAGGFVGTIFIAYLSGLTNVAYTATQYALFTSVMTLPGRLLGSYSGDVAEALGWSNFFIYTALAGIPAVVLAWYVARRDAGRRA
jgi:MFS transporter, PAT family, beta-lactamase induction signal transducer AmpG